MNFVDVEPTLENYWRAIILFGRNTASYKFALAKSLIDVSLNSKSDLIICQTTLMLNQLITFFPNLKDKTKVINNPFDFPSAEIQVIF